MIARPCRRTCRARPLTRVASSASHPRRRVHQTQHARAGMQLMDHERREQRHRHPEHHRVDVDPERALQHPLATQGTGGPPSPTRGRSPRAPPSGATAAWPRSTRRRRGSVDDVVMYAPARPTPAISTPASAGPASCAMLYVVASSAMPTAAAPPAAAVPATPAAPASRGRTRRPPGTRTGTAPRASAPRAVRSRRARRTEGDEHVGDEEHPPVARPRPAIAPPTIGSTSSGTSSHSPISPTASVLPVMA